MPIHHLNMQLSFKRAGRSSQPAPSPFHTLTNNKHPVRRLRYRIFLYSLHFHSVLFEGPCMCRFGYDEICPTVQGIRRVCLQLWLLSWLLVWEIAGGEGECTFDLLKHLQHLSSRTKRINTSFLQRLLI